MASEAPKGGVYHVEVDSEGDSHIRRVQTKPIPADESVWSKRLGAIVQSMREGLQVIDREYRYVYVNEAAARHGRASRIDLIGERMVDRYPGIEHSDLWVPLTRAMEERITQTIHTEFQFPDGTKGWFQSRFEPIPEGVLVLSIEVTQEHNLELQLRQAQKMEAIGRLAGGLAHDFNNLLTVILAYTTLLQGQVPAPLSDDLAQVEAAAQRATMLTRQLLTMSRSQITRPEVISAHARIRALTPMMTSLLGNRIKVQLKLGAGDDHIQIDPVQLDQVLLNLSTNARDAMPQGGSFTLATKGVIEGVAHEATAPVDQLEPAHFLRIRVTDTGPGMSSEVAENAFEPFFTTKGPHQGTGLGLCTSRTIIRQAGGDLVLAQSSTRGCTFDILLPTAHAPLHPGLGSLPSLDELRSEATVLVIETDSALRQACCRMLRALGYTVFEAAGALEARELAAHYPGPIDCVIVELSLPDHSGPELVRQIKRLRPPLKALYLTSHEDDEALQGINKSDLVVKPFVPHTLAHQLLELLKK